MNFKILFILSICLYLFTGCSQKSVEISDNKKPTTKNTSLTSLRDNANSKLNDFYTEWEGVKYQFGGESKNGIDCSAFVKKAYEDNFSLEIPRTTTLQSQIGKEIYKNELDVGDLVFFKTEKTQHVGIYLENGRFMHASTKKGVTISDLDNSYFTKNYWKAQRIID